MTITDFLNGEIVRLARRLGVEAPINAALLRIVEGMAADGEKPGKYTPEQLPDLLGLDTPDTSGEAWLTRTTIAEVQHMNCRQRVLAALNHREPDRVPIDVGS